MILYLRFSQREVFLCNCLIVPKGRQLMRKELSPFSCWSHMIYNLSTQLFIFSDRVRFVEDAIFFLFQWDTSEALRTRLAVIKIITLYTSPGIRTKCNTVCWERTQTFERPFPCCVIRVIGILRSSSCWNISEFFSLSIIKTFKTIRTRIQIVTNTIFIFYSVSRTMCDLKKHLLESFLEKLEVILKRNFFLFLFVFFGG